MPTGRVASTGWWDGLCSTVYHPNAHIRSRRSDPATTTPGLATRADTGPRHGPGQKQKNLDNAMRNSEEFASRE